VSGSISSKVCNFVGGLASVLAEDVPRRNIEILAKRGRQARIRIPTTFI
jgi:hypothetical protein